MEELGHANPPEIVPGLAVVLEIVLQISALLVPHVDTACAHNVPDANPAEKITVIF